MGKLHLTNNVKKFLAAIDKERGNIATIGDSFKEPMKMYQDASIAYCKLSYAAKLLQQAEAALSSMPEMLEGTTLRLYQMICHSELDEPGYYEIDVIVSVIGASDGYKRIDNLVDKILKPCQQLFDAEMQRSFDFQVVKEDMEKKKSKVTGVFIIPRLSNYRLSPDVVTSFLQSRMRKGKEEYEQKIIDDSKGLIENFCHLPDAIPLWESCLYNADSPSINAPVSYTVASLRKCLEKADAEKVAWASNNDTEE